MYSYIIIIQSNCKNNKIIVEFILPGGVNKFGGKFTMLTYGFISRSNLNNLNVKFVWRSHLNNNEPAESIQLVREICTRFSFKLSYIYKLKQLVRENFTMPVYICDTCNRSYIYKKNLKIHLQESHCML